MFKVVVTKPSDSSKFCQCFASPHAFDFIHVLPNQMTHILGEPITKDDMVIYKYSEADVTAVVDKINETAGNYYDCDSGADNEIKVNDSVDVMLQSWSGTALNPAWPYDENGDWLGNN